MRSRTYSSLHGMIRREKWQWDVMFIRASRVFWYYHMHHHCLKLIYKAEQYSPGLLEFHSGEGGGQRHDFLWRSYVYTYLWRSHEISFRSVFPPGNLYLVYRDVYLVLIFLWACRTVINICLYILSRRIFWSLEMSLWVLADQRPSWTPRMGVPGMMIIHRVAILAEFGNGS